MSEERPYRRLSPLTPLVRSFIVVVAAVWASWDDLLRGDPGPLALLLLALLAGGAVYGAASWLRTKYWIEAEELRVDTGVISRQSRRIRIDRLQGIDIVQPFVARLFGLAELRMDVAGGSRGEGSLAFLRLEDARQLKDQLLARRDALRAQEQPSSDGEAVVAAAPAAPSPARLLARVRPTTLLLSLLLSLDTLVLVLVVLGLVVSSLMAESWVGLSATLPVLLGLGLVQVRRFAAGYNFTVSQTDAGLEIRRGLLELSSQTITLPRVMGVVVSEPVLWRRLGWARLDVSLAGYSSSSSGEEGPAASTVLPVGDRALVLWLARYVLSSLDPEAPALTGPGRRARWAAPVAHRFMAAGAGEQLAVSRQGRLTRRLQVVPHARVQSVRLKQGPWQRRLGLADVHLDSPPGPVDVRARHREADEARRILEAEVAVTRRARRSQGEPA